MDKYNFFRKGGPRPTAGQLLDTQFFYRNAVEIYDCFDEWRDTDEFYFIPLHMQMTYSCAGWVAEMAPDPVWLGSFVRCTLSHPELFRYACPRCGALVFPHRYCGSPLSGRVDLEGHCKCGWKGFETVSGWRLRATALRDQISNDRLRYLKFRSLHPGRDNASIGKLLRELDILTE